MVAHVATDTEKVTVEDVDTAANGSVSNRSTDVVSVAAVAAYATSHCQLINRQAVPSLPMTQLRVPASGRFIKSLVALAVPLAYLYVTFLVLPIDHEPVKVAVRMTAGWPNCG